MQEERKALEKPGGMAKLLAKMDPDLHEQTMMKLLEHLQVGGTLRPVSCVCVGTCAAPHRRVNPRTPCRAGHTYWSVWHVSC